MTNRTRQWLRETVLDIVHSMPELGRTRLRHTSRLRLGDVGEPLLVVPAIEITPHGRRTIVVTAAETHTTMRRLIAAA